MKYLLLLSFNGGVGITDGPDDADTWRAAIIKQEFKPDALTRFVANAYFFVPVKEKPLA